MLDQEAVTNSRKYRILWGSRRETWRFSIASRGESECLSLSWRSRVGGAPRGIRSFSSAPYNPAGRVTEGTQSSQRGDRLRSRGRCAACGAATTLQRKSGHDSQINGPHSDTVAVSDIGSAFIFVVNNVFVKCKKKLQRNWKTFICYRILQRQNFFWKNICLLKL